ncbi:MAG: hybrid sensor histidine kinase/response regulator [Deltaproteobacteria bacterium]|nr:hybrid sensor histidine kinase/response regulator [Deltaproteobacteria bacterium]
MADPLTGTVLVVDDNAENRALARATLEDEGFTVVLAISGEEALVRFAQTRADCVLLDIRMPGLDGVAVCARLRQIPGGGDVPILFVTAQRDLDTFDRAREVGGDDFITKPYRPSELVTRVGAAIKLRRMSIERGELFELIRTQRDDLMRIQLQKEQLAAFIVHDLKNPVNAIELHGQRILRDPAASERARDAASKIQSETRALLRMISNLLDLSKADEGQLLPTKELVELDGLFQDVLLDMGPRALAANVSLTHDRNALRVFADPALTRRILENLVDNAIRHAPEDSAIQVTARRGAAGVEVRVVDAGTGIPLALREKIFDRFVQAGAESSRTGHGLGLAFCKLAVEAHGGRIWIEDAAPGAVFCVEWPDA